MSIPSFRSVEAMIKLRRALRNAHQRLGQPAHRGLVARNAFGLRAPRGEVAHDQSEVELRRLYTYCSQSSM
eukprot:9045406-Pyramimonas_sp.AAC.1